jgi:hypothetical protein
MYVSLLNLADECTYLYFHAASPHLLIQAATLVTSVTMCAVTLITLALLLALDSSSWLRRSWWLSALLAPAGALVRYEAALQLNSRWQNGRFHWGTFAVNIAGSVAQVLLAHAATAATVGRALLYR